MSLCSPREAYIYCSTMNSHNAKHYSATGDTSRRDSVLRAATCTAEEPAQSRTDQLLIGEQHSNANICSNNCLFRLEVLIKKSCYIKLRLQLDAVSSQFLFKVYINWNSKKTTEILWHVLDSNDLSVLPAAGMIDPDYVQIREHREDMKMLSQTCSVALASHARGGTFSRHPLRCLL